MSFQETTRVTELWNPNCMNMGGSVYILGVALLVRRHEMQSAKFAFSLWKQIKNHET